jgi:phosphoserine phosphatase
MELGRLSPQRFWDFRNRCQTLLERPDVKTGSADQNWQPPRGSDGGNFVQRQATPIGDGAALASVQKTVEPVRRALFSSGIGTRRQDAEITVNLQTVGVYDGAAECVRQLDRERRFAARGRTGDDEDGRPAFAAYGGQLVVGACSGVGRRLMEMVLTLIAGPYGRASLPRLALTIAGALGIEGEPIWLAADACDLVLGATGQGQVPGKVEQTARALIDGAGIDVLVQPVTGRRKRLLIADLEATIIENEMLDELAEPVGLRPQVAAITRRAMNGEIDFSAALEARVALLRGMEVRRLEDAAARIRLTSGARALVATMRRGGAATALVSGGFAVFAEPVAASLGFERVIANRLELAQGRITGIVHAPIVTGDTKQEALLALAAELGLAPAETIAVGDGANDLPMLAAAGIGIAFRPKPRVAKAARWRLDHADLTGLLYAQGYRKEEIVG